MDNTHSAVAFAPADPPSPREILHRIEASLEARSGPDRYGPDWFAEVGDVLAELGACLQWQVDADAAPESLLSEIRLATPRLAGRIERLRRDQEQLIDATAALGRRVTGDPDVAGEEVRDRLSAIGRRFRALISAEADVVHEALARDLGTGD